MPTSGGALGLATLQPAADAFQVKKLRDAGAVILGKTTMHELAAGITTISSLTGQTRNPYDLLPRARRIERRHRRGDRRELRGRGHGQRHVRIDSHSGREPESRRPARHARPVEPQRRDAAVVDAGHRRSARAQRHRSRDHARRDRRRRSRPTRSRPRAPAHIPKSYRDALSADGLKGARIGVLRALWGTAPEDDEVAGIVRKALDGFKAQGAEVVDVSVPGLDDLLRDSSVIGDEFKFDLAAYLAKIPNAPVKSLGEILDRGLHHAELDATFRLRNQPEKRETEHYRQAMIKRRALRAAVLATLEELRIDALAYPTLRRKPALIGEAQGGTNCQLSATTGLAGDCDAGGIQHRRPADRARAARRRVGRSEAVEVRVCVGAGDQAAASAVQHAAAREGRRAGADSRPTSRSASAIDQARRTTPRPARCATTPPR